MYVRITTSGKAYLRMNDSFNVPVPDKSEHIDITAEMMAASCQSEKEPDEPSEREQSPFDSCRPVTDHELSAESFSSCSFEDLFPEDYCDIDGSQNVHEAGLKDSAQTEVERRRKRRALISAPVRVRGVDLTHARTDEVSTTIDVSRLGILFESANRAYFRGMEVAVTFPYVQSHGAWQTERKGLVVRVREKYNGRWAVAIALAAGVGSDLVDASGRKSAGASAHPTFSGSAEQKGPLVLALDSDGEIRGSMKAYLTNEGYNVIALNNSSDAREALKMFTPALVIAEIEGETLPGYDLCAFIKADERLRHIPVVLTTSSGYPSDYANAHALGAIVCMAKPFKQERLGQVVRLLAPTARAKKQTAPVRAADPSRKPGVNGRNGRIGNSSSG